MLTKLQIWLEPYLGVFGVNVWLQAMVAILGSLLLALIFDRVICNLLHKLAARTQFHLDDYLIDQLHRPIYVTLLLIGLALAVNLLQLGEPFEAILFSLLLTLGYILWNCVRAASLCSRLQMTRSKISATIREPTTATIACNQALLPNTPR